MHQGLESIAPGLPQTDIPFAFDTSSLNETIEVAAVGDSLQKKLRDGHTVLSVTPPYQRRVVETHDGFVPQTWQHPTRKETK